MTDTEYGFIQIKLKNILKDKGLSRNKLSHKTEMQKSQINAYYNNTITRLDTAVLARLCTALDCRIEDLLEFVPYSNPSE